MLTMTVFINDEPHTLPAQTTLAVLLSDLGRKAKFCAVERNSELVPRTRHEQCQLCDGDRLEIVTLVGGG